MRTFSNDFRNALNDIRQLNGIVYYYSSDGYYVLSQENDDALLTEIEDELATEKGMLSYDSDSIYSIRPMFEVKLFKTICKTVEIETTNKINKNTMISCKIGAMVGNAYEYMDYGDFKIIDEPTYKADTKSYLTIGYDKMVESMVSYDDNPLSIAYPITHKNLVIAICNKFGWQYELENYTNYNKIIDTDLYSNQDLTYRDILDDLCQVTGTNFMFNNDDKFTTKDITDTGTSIDDNYIKDINVNLSEKYGKINALKITSEGTTVIGSEEDGNSIIQNGKTEFIINNNRLMLYNSDLFLNDLFEKIDGLEYYIYDIDTTGLLIYEPLDRFTISHNDIDYSCVMFGNDTKLTRGLVETIYTDKPSETKEKYEANIVDSEKVKNAIVSINKAKGEIVLKVNSEGKLVAVQLNSDADDGSEFNVNADNINFSGHNFNVTSDNMKITIGIGENQKEIINSNGLLTNLQFSTFGKYRNYDILGFEGISAIADTQIVYSDISLDVAIPENFTIIKAIVTIYHTPIDWWYYDDGINDYVGVYGSSKKINLYKASNLQNYKFTMGYYSEYEFQDANMNLQVIPNAFGSDGYTATNTTGSTIEVINSIDIKDELSVGNNKLVLRTSKQIPTNLEDALTDSGMARAVINILGYYAV